MLKFYNADFQGRVLLARKKAFRGRSLFFVKSNKRLSHKIRFMVNPSKLRRKNLTFAGLSFIMKQRLRRYYAHLKEHQFRRQFIVARKQKKSGGLPLACYFLRLLESRLDATIQRSNFFGMGSIRQLIRHKYVKVNDAVVNQLSKRIHPGDVITFKSHPLLVNIPQRVRNAYRKKTRMWSAIRNRFSLSFASYIAVPHLLFDLKRLRIFVVDSVQSEEYVFFPFEVDVSRFLCTIYAAVK